VRCNNSYFRPLVRDVKKYFVRRTKISELSSFCHYYWRWSVGARREPDARESVRPGETAEIRGDPPMKTGLLAAALSTLLWTVAVQAQSGNTASTVPARDPNPPYGAAAGAKVESTPKVLTAPTVAPPGTTSNAGQSGNANANAGTTGSAGTARQGNNSGSSSSGATQASGATRPGANIASRGSTTADSRVAPQPYDPSNTPGWSMMTPQEQQSYSGRMSGFTSVAQCRAYQQAYMAQIQARARSMGQIVQSEGADPCATLQQQGALK
jgi:hypothetical protein